MHGSMHSSKAHAHRYTWDYIYVYTYEPTICRLMAFDDVPSMEPCKCVPGGWTRLLALHASIPPPPQLMSPR